MVFIFALPPALYGRDLARVLFRPDVFSDVWKARVLDSGLLMGRMQDGFNSDRWLEALGEEGQILKPAFKYLSESERSEILRLLLPEGWLPEQLNNTVQEFLAWVDSDQSVPVVTLDLTPLKAHLRDGGIDSMVEILVDSWPSCTAEGASRLERELVAGAGSPSEYCEPSEPMRSELVHLASSSLLEQVDHLPGRLQLFEEADSIEAAKVKEQLVTLRSVALWAWFLPASMLGLIMAFTVRGIDDLRRWWGGPVLLGGLMTITLMILLGSARSDLAADLTRSLAGSGAFIQPLLMAGLEGLITNALSALLFQALLLSVLGLIVWFGLKWLLGRRGGAGSTIAANEASVSDLPEQAGGPPPMPPLDTTNEPEAGEPPSGIFG